MCGALSEIFKKRTNGMELVKSHLVYVASADDTSDDLYFIDKAIKDEEQHIVELANLEIKSPNNRDKYESAISDCTDRIRVLRERREEILRQLNFNQAAKAEIERIERYLTEDRAVVTDFDDCTVRRLVNSISVSKDMEPPITLTMAQIVSKDGLSVCPERIPGQRTVPCPPPFYSATMNRFDIKI